MCNTCRRHVEKGNLPPMAYHNGLQMYDWDRYNEKQFLELNEVAVCLIALNNIFQKIYLLPKSRWSAIKDRLINVPIPEHVVQETVDMLPKLPTKAGLIPIKYKRRKSFKNTHKEEVINPNKIIQALKILVKKHPAYENINVDECFVQTCQENEPEIHSALFDDTPDLTDTCLLYTSPSPRD